jgi:hypothetical protein
MKESIIIGGVAVKHHLPRATLDKNRVIMTNYIFYQAGRPSSRRGVFPAGPLVRTRLLGGKK